MANSVRVEVGIYFILLTIKRNVLSMKRNRTQKALHLLIFCIDFSLSETEEKRLKYKVKTKKDFLKYGLVLLCLRVFSITAHVDVSRYFFFLLSRYTRASNKVPKEHTFTNIS